MELLQIILFVIYFLLILWIINKHSFFADGGVNRKALISIFIIKFLAFVFTFWMYTYYYTDRLNADMYKYFDDANWLYECLVKSPRVFVEVITRDIHSADAIYYDAKVNHWFMSNTNGSLNSHRVIIIFNLVCRFISMGNIFIHGLIINAFSFAGLWAIYKSLAKFTERPSGLLFVMMACCPSVLIWGSALLKEPLILCFLGFSIYFLNQLYVRFTYRNLSLLIVFVILLLVVKAYVAYAFIIAASLLILFAVFRFKHMVWIAASYAALLIILFTFASKIDSSSNPLRILESKVLQMDAINKVVVAGSTYKLPMQTNISVRSLFKGLPNILLISFIRPFPWEAKNPFMLLSFFENAILLFLLALSIVFFLVNSKALSLHSMAIGMSLILFILIIYCLSGLVAMNFGTLMRYKMPALLFLCSMSFLIFPLNFYQKVDNYLK